MKKMRMTLPKKEEDLEKVVKEVMELHPELAHEHHHHHHMEELTQTLDILFDVIHTRLSEIEIQLRHLTRHIEALYKMYMGLIDAMNAKKPSEVEETIKRLAEELKSIANALREASS